MAKKTRSKGAWITIGVGTLICLGLPAWFTFTGELGLDFWKQILLSFWEPMKSMPIIMAIVLPVYALLVIIAVRQASKQPEPPRCPTCGQILPEGKEDLAAKPKDILV